MSKIGIRDIRAAVTDGKYIIKAHAKQRMGVRKIGNKDILNVIHEGEIVEEHPEGKPFPKCLIMGFVEETIPMYVSCAFDGEYVHIITVHWLDPEKWIDPWTRRR